MKSLCFFSILFLTSFSVSAESFFKNGQLGVALISQSAELKISGNGGSSTFSENGFGLGLYFDRFVDKKYRYNATLSYIGYDDFDITSLVVSADYIKPVNYNFSLFAGAAGGLAMQKFSSASVSDSAVAPVYGVQVGGFAYINERLMLELGYRFRPTSLETDVSIPAGTVAETEDLSEVYLNIQIGF